MGAESKLREAARRMADRLKLFRKVADQARETGDAVHLMPEELWERADEEALSAFEAAEDELSGARPLFPEVVHV